MKLFSTEVIIEMFVWLFEAVGSDSLRDDEKTKSI